MNGKVYMYVVDRDFGFAPNPFHGYCTLATCKPRIRKAATVGDWVVGMGGSRLKAQGRCVFAMQVTAKLDFNKYWHDPLFHDKKPVRNGSMKMMVGDNVYHWNADAGRWIQSDSHHSNEDGSTNFDNLKRDTGTTDQVLVSKYFFYFGKEAPRVPTEILSKVGFKNGIGHRVFEVSSCEPHLNWLHGQYGSFRNVVAADPFDFEHGNLRYSVRTNKIS